jgi:hypothetical protein
MIHWSASGAQKRKMPLDERAAAAGPALFDDVTD